MAERAPLQPPKRKTAARFAAGLLRCGAGAFVLLLFLPQLAAQALPSQYDVEAAYLLDFGKFTELSTSSPALRRTTFDVCILGRDPIGPTIDKLAANETVENHAVRVLHGISPSRARTCAIAFISTRDGDEIRQDLDLLAGADVLTVGDSPDFLNAGGMIQFVVDKNHVRFAVNLDAVRKAHLVLSSQLLRVALYVKGEPQPEAGP
ncbi:MAG TPA: YfiR family protein [Terracidiphilus sp.]|nr:YfiR family protein [Terracidiphilus sp.]